MHQTLCELNAEALRHYKATQYAEAATVYNDLFRKVKKENLTHAELYNCYNNCAAALLQLEQYDAALQHAECARKLAEQALHRQAPHCTESGCGITLQMWF